MSIHILATFPAMQFHSSCLCLAARTQMLFDFALLRLVIPLRAHLCFLETLPILCLGSDEGVTGKNSGRVLVSDTGFNITWQLKLGQIKAEEKAALDLVRYRFSSTMVKSGGWVLVLVPRARAAACPVR